MTTPMFANLDDAPAADQFSFDDGAGLRVVEAAFQGERKFSWRLFDGYDSIRVLTYSAGISAIVRLLDRHDFKTFECVFGSEHTLHDLRDILAFQQYAIGDTRAAIKGLKDERHALILSRVREGQARFRVLRKAIAHSKLYLLENTENGATRVIMGSANLSETAFGGRQSETLVRYDDQPEAWAHYLRQYEDIRNSASDEIELPPERIERAPIELNEVPVLDPKNQTTLVIDAPNSGSDLQSFDIPTTRVVERALARRASVPTEVAALAPPFRNGQQRISPQARQKIRREITRHRIVRHDEEANPLNLSIDMQRATAEMSGQPFDLTAEDELVQRDARLMLQFFANYSETFSGDTERLQRDYFMLWSWLYFAPFMCDARLIAGATDNIFRYPSFAIVYGKTQCGKSSLVDTLMTSMFGREYRTDKGEFRRGRLRTIQQNYRRMPVVFDDLNRNDLRTYGTDIIKDENPPPVDEHPCFILSMNADTKAFAGEIIRRCMMVYTEAALPSWKESEMNRLEVRVKEMRRDMTGHLYRRYLIEAIAGLQESRRPADWLEFSSTIICNLLADVVEGDNSDAPEWLRPATWSEYAAKRHDQVKAQLVHLLRSSTRIKNESAAESGWILERDKVIVIEKTDAFGRRAHNWENVPSTLIDENASVGGRTVLNRAELEDFLGVSLKGGDGFIGRLTGLFARTKD